MNRFSNGWGYIRDEDYPDHSKYLWHLTSNRSPLNKKWKFGNKLRDDTIGTLNSLERLVSILSQYPYPTIWSSHFHYMSPDFHKVLKNHIKGVCFTECIPYSMPEHSKRFSRYGLLFKKETAYQKKVRPVWYIDAELMNQFAKCDYASQRGNKPHRDFPEEYLHLLMPFVPKYGEYRMGGKTLDFSVEREWRVGKDFKFSLDDVAAVIVPTREDIDRLISEVPETSECQFVPVEDINRNNIEHRDFDSFFVTS